MGSEFRAKALLPSLSFQAQESESPRRLLHQGLPSKLLPASVCCLRTRHAAAQGKSTDLLSRRTPIMANQYHCATVPDGPNCEWANGEYERIEAKKRAAPKTAGI
jgi:hypothetical protein